MTNEELMAENKELRKEIFDKEMAITFLRNMLLEQGAKDRAVHDKKEAARG